MKTKPIAGLTLAVFLQLAPVAARMAPSVATLPNSPAAILFKWVVGALSIAGTYHTVSAATAVLASATSVKGKSGTRLSYQVKINDGQNRQPKSWLIGGQTFGSSGFTTLTMPPGLSLSLATGIISGTPTEGGLFRVALTAYEDPNRRGGKLAFTLEFIIESSLAAPAITSGLAGVAVHVGEPVTLAVAATGTGPLKFQWLRNGIAVSETSTPDLTVPGVGVTEGGAYSVVVSGSGGQVSSAAVDVAVVPLSMAAEFTGGKVNLSFESIPGREYLIEANSVMSVDGWTEIDRIVAGGSATAINDADLSSGHRFWRCRVMP